MVQRGAIWRLQLDRIAPEKALTERYKLPADGQMSEAAVTVTSRLARPCGLSLPI
jgi:hypothetical protein